MTSIKSLVGCIVGPFLAASLQELHKQSALGAVAVGVVVVVAAVVVVVVAVVVVVVVARAPNWFRLRHRPLGLLECHTHRCC